MKEGENVVNAKKIESLRLSKKLNRIEFADVVNSSPAMIKHVEYGIKQPSVALLKRMSDYFDCKVDDLIISA